MEEGERLASLNYTPDQIQDALLDPNDRFKSIKNPKQARYFVQRKALKERNFEPAAEVADEIGSNFLSIFCQLDHNFILALI